jgi:phage tail sheath protein FI
VGTGAGTEAHLHVVPSQPSAAPAAPLAPVVEDSHAPASAAGEGERVEPGPATAPEAPAPPAEAESTVARSGAATAPPAATLTSTETGTGAPTQPIAEAGPPAPTTAASQPAPPVVTAQQPAPPVALAPAAKAKPYVNQTHLLRLSDVDIIERQTEIARAAGVKMRKNGNPSLIVRAALRLLEEVREKSPDEWLQRIRNVAMGSPES